MQKTERNDDAFALIRRCAGQAPSSIALQAPGGKPLTFAQLLDQMARTQEALHHYIVGPNEVVALALPDGPEMVTAVLGVGQTRVCAPLNPGLAAAEFESHLSSLRPAALLSPFGMDSAATAAARAVGVPVLDLCLMPDAPAGVFTVSPRCGTRPEQRRIAMDAAILLFTSATTGKPKLVPLSHSNLEAIYHNTNQALGLSDADRFLSLMPLFHLQGLASVLAQLYVGGSVTCAPAFDPALFLS
jgi:acyl-CoA synthetase (AMP-forming)/AMP-acid ligase II